MHANLSDKNDFALVDYWGGWMCCGVMMSLTEGKTQMQHKITDVD